MTEPDLNNIVFPSLKDRVVIITGAGQGIGRVLDIQRLTMPIGGPKIGKAPLVGSPGLAVEVTPDRICAAPLGQCRIENFSYHLGEPIPCAWLP